MKKGLILLISMLCLVVMVRSQITVIAEPVETQDVSRENYEWHQVDGHILTIKTATKNYEVEAITNDIIRVELTTDGLKKAPRMPVVVRDPGPIGLVEDLEDALVYTTINTTVYIEKEPLRFVFIHMEDTVLQEKNGYFNRDGSAHISFEMNEGEAWHGTGFRAIDANLKGRSLEMLNQAHYGYDADYENLNIAIPFLVSTGGYGIYFDHTFPGSVEIGVDSDELLYQTDQTDLTYYFIGAENMSALMDHYSGLTGKPILPPRWALGFIQSRYGYETEEEARSVVARLQEENFPLDALVLDLFWFGDKHLMGDLDWADSLFQNPEGMMSDFRAKGVKTIVITEPYITEISKNFQLAVDSGYTVTDSTGKPYIIEDFWAGPSSLLDLMDSEVQDWMWTFYDNRLEEGVAGWWCDLGEPENHPKGMIHHGKSADQVHNYFSWEWARMLHSKYASHYPEKRLFNLIRSGTAGMQRFGSIPWSGDIQRSYAGLQSQVPIMVNMGYSGVPYIHSDLGGFTGGPENPELYTRWLQFGAFTPVMRAHGEGVPPEPTHYEKKYKDIVRDYIEMRYRLLPYNYSLAIESALTGAPFARGMDYYDMGNTKYHDINDQYYWGEQILVAPVMDKGMFSRSVLLPEGNWYDYHTGRLYEGGQEVKVEAPLETLPLFVKGGSFIPHTDLVMTTDDYKANQFSVHFYTDPSVAESSYTMYNDNGMDPMSIQNEQYETITFSGTWNENLLTVQVDHEGSYEDMPDYRDLELVFKNVNTYPASIKLNGSRVRVIEDDPDAERIQHMNYYNSDKKELTLDFQWDGNRNIKIEIEL